MARTDNRLLHIAPGFAGVARDLETMEAKFAANADVLYAKRNVVKKVQLGAHTLVAKAFKRPSFIQAFIYANCRKSKALRAFEHAARLERAGYFHPSTHRCH